MKVQTIEFVVIGTPAPQPRPRAGVRLGRTPIAQIYNPGTADKWRASVAAAARIAHRGPMLVGPVSVSIMIYGKRPKRLCRKKDDPAAQPMIARGSGDSDNYAKAVLDAIEGILFENDSQVTPLVVEKKYTAIGCRPGAHVVVVGRAGGDDENSN